MTWPEALRELVENAETIAHRPSNNWYRHVYDDHRDDIGNFDILITLEGIAEGDFWGWANNLDETTHEGTEGWEVMA